MKRKYKKILKIVALLLLVAGMLKVFFPEVVDEVLAIMKGSSQKQGVVGEISSTLKQADKVLGEKVSKFSQQLSSGEGPIDIEAIVGKIVDTETVREVEQKIEDVVQEKTEKIQKIPEEAVDEVKSAAKEEVRRRVCEEWLE